MAGKGHRKGRENRKNCHSRLVRRARTFHRRTTDIHQSARDDLGKNEARAAGNYAASHRPHAGRRTATVRHLFQESGLYQIGSQENRQRRVRHPSPRDLASGRRSLRQTDGNEESAWDGRNVDDIFWRSVLTYSARKIQAIIRGSRMTYRHRSIDRTKFDRYRKRYSPYASVASLYLWAVASGAVDGMKDCKPLKNKVRRKNKPPKTVRHAGGNLSQIRI